MNKTINMNIPRPIDKVELRDFMATKESLDDLRFTYKGDVYQEMVQTSWSRYVTKVLEHRASRMDVSKMTVRHSLPWRRF